MISIAYLHIGIVRGEKKEWCTMKKYFAQVESVLFSFSVSGHKERAREEGKGKSERVMAGHKFEAWGSWENED